MKWWARRFWTPEWWHPEWWPGSIGRTPVAATVEEGGKSPARPRRVDPHLDYTLQMDDDAVLLLLIAS